MIRRFKISKFYGLILIFSLGVSIAKASDTLDVVHTIGYKTKNASEVTLVWGINEWKLPDEKYRPPDSYVKNGILYTVLSGSTDSFYINLNLPENTYINYIFWCSKDLNGKEDDYWDKNSGQNYNAFVNSNVSSKIHIDKDSHLRYPFDLYSWAWKLLVISLVLLLLILYASNKSNLFSRITKHGSWILGTSLSVLIIMLLARLHMNLIVQESPWLIVGAGFYDALFLATFSITGYFALSRVKVFAYRKILFISLFILLMFFALIAIVNIDIVKYLGTPLNYQWFYYSDFLKSNDAKNAIQKNLNLTLIRDIILLIAFVITSGILFSCIFILIKKRIFLVSIISVSLVLFFIFGYSQVKDRRFQRNKILNPTTVFVSSLIKAESNLSLFSMTVSDSVRKDVEKLFYEKEVPIDTSNIITNVIIFVLESTPAEYLGVFGSKFKATPNLDYWEKNARIYKNVYAHIPATSNGLFSIVSGIYPDISYKLTCSERPDFPVLSIAGLLRENNWESGSFNAADINFNSMDLYLDYQAFDTVADFRDFACPNANFQSDWEYLDGVADECMVKGALNWIKSSTKNNLLLCWTMQTHYPYFVVGEEKIFDTGNVDFNRYLNALKNSDEAFGNLMNGLKQLDILDETLVIVVGDHGEAFGRHDQTTHGSKIYEENIHIPCMLINRRLFHGEKDDRIGGLTDIAPTIANILNLKSPKEWQGQSLLNPKPFNRTFFFCPYADFLFGTRKDNWKLIYNATELEFELYDLYKDPLETTNLADQFPEIVNKEYEYLAAWVQHQNSMMKVYMNKKK